MTQRVRLEFDLALDPNEPIAGSLSGADGSERGFTGWLDLLAALEAVCAGAREEAARRSDSGGRRATNIREVPDVTGSQS